jgi:hypothetical protein
MTTSGTATFNLDLADIIQEAHDRAGVEFRGGYEYRTARRALDLMMAEWSNRGYNLWTVEQKTLPLTAGTANYSLPADTIDVLDVVLRTSAGDPANQVDLYLNRITLPTYAAIPNKLLQARPLQVYVDRQSTPQINLWPVPDGTQAYTVVYWRMRRIQDTGTPASNTMDIPSRFLPALVAGLAYYVAMRRPESRQLVPGLKAVYDEQWGLAAGEDRDRSSYRFVPFVDYSL